jgi:hypothetical protein
MSFGVNDILGAFEVGVLLSLFLFGVICAQTYTYFDTYPDDRYLKILVCHAYLHCRY